MPRDTNGNMTRPVSYTPNTKARANDVNANENDMAAEITDSLSRSGKGGMLVPLKITDGGTGADTAAIARANLGAASKTGESFTGTISAPAFVIPSDGNRALTFTSVSGTVKGVLFQDSASDDLLFSRSAGGQLRVGAAKCTYSGIFQGTGVNIFVDSNRNVTFGRADGTVLGYVFCDYGSGDLFLSLANGRSIRLADAGVTVNTAITADGNVTAPAVVVKTNLNASFSFLRANGSARGYVFCDAATDDILILKADNSATIRIGSVGFTYNNNPVAIMPELRSRHITNGSIDNIAVGRLSADGSTKPVVGADYAGSSIVTADGFAPFGFAGTWRCLSLVSPVSPWIGLFYRYL